MKNQHTHRIELTEAQLIAVADALEFTNRFCSGQLDLSAFPNILREHIPFVQREDVRFALSHLKRQLFPELSPQESTGVGHALGDKLGEYNDILYEVYRTILEHRTAEQLEAKPDKHTMNVYAHPGLQYTDEQKIAITRLQSVPKKEEAIINYPEL